MQAGGNRQDMRLATRMQVAVTVCRRKALLGMALPQSGSARLLVIGGLYASSIKPFIRWVEFWIDDD